MSKINNYSLEFKKSSANLAYESSQAVAKTARNLGVNSRTLYGWIHKYCDIKQEVTLNKDQQKSEIIRLEKELKQVKMERDILKKAAAYFSQAAL